jgi:hypothetical protein
MNVSGVTHLVVTMTAEMKISATSKLSMDRTIPLFTIPVSLYGVSVEVPVALRIKANGEGFIEFTGRVDTQFGIRNNKASAQVNVSHSIDYRFSARVELSATIQAKARVFYVPVYGIQGDFGIGARTDDAMQAKCPDGSCFVVGLFDVRNLRSLDWGALGWIPALQFNVNLATDETIGFRYLSDGRWYDRCPHDAGNPQGSDSPDISQDPSQNTSHDYLGDPVPLEEAQRTPGLYIKSSDGFILVKPQWTTIDYDYIGFRSEVAETVFALEYYNMDVANLMPILYDADFELPKIPNNAQLVIIGITDVAIYEVAYDGWTIPVGLSLGVPGGPNPGGWIQTYAESKILAKYSSGSDQAFETINGNPPSDYVDRMLYTGYRYLLASFHGILVASQGEEFTFAWWRGTDWVQETYTADKRFYALPTYGIDDAIQANYEIVKTQDGYFEVDFLTPPIGCYGVGRSFSRFDCIVEFVSP